jgi:hypothetical protein
MCYKYINLHIKCNVSSTCNILNLSCVQEYVGGLWQLFCGIPYSFLSSLLKNQNYMTFCMVGPFFMFILTGLNTLW